MALRECWWKIIWFLNGSVPTLQVISTLSQHSRLERCPDPLVQPSKKHSQAEDLQKVPEVIIDEGTFKYVSLNANQGNNVKHVRYARWSIGGTRPNGPSEGRGQCTMTSFNGTLSSDEVCSASLRS